MSFTNAPVSRALIVALVLSSIAVSLLDAKHYFYISVSTHILRYRQLWRALAYQLCYTNSSELLFACMSLYNLRIVERMWGPRKYASFVMISYLLTSVLTLVLLAALRAATWGVVDFLPAGPTAVVFALLAQYHAVVPHTYKYRLALVDAPATAATAAMDATYDHVTGLTLSDKSYRYLLAAQLALFQWPGSLLGAAVGWLLGYAWHNDVLPGAVTRWRVPGWLVGVKTQRSNDFEGLRRRLEAGVPREAPAVASGRQAPNHEGVEGSRQRNMG